jgi:hypothetical protein
LCLQSARQDAEPAGELARWLARCGGLTPDHVPRIEAYVARFLSKAAYNPAALEGQQRMKKGATRAAKRAHIKASVTMVTANQLNRELASAQTPSPPPDPATSVAWNHDNGLAVPDHLTPEPGLTVQEARPSVEATPADPADIPQPDPWPLPAPYTDVPMEDIENIDKWAPSSS